MTYTPQAWADGDVTKPLSAARMTVIENGIAAATGTDEAVNTVATSGATQTIPLPTVQSISRITLSANCTLTFPTAAAGRSFTVVLVQDSTARTVTWPAAAKWANGIAPALSGGSAQVDAFAFSCVDGTNWLATIIGQDFH